MVVQENKRKFETFEEFYKAVIFHNKSITLPDNRILLKGLWVGVNGFDVEGFNNRLIDIYNNEFKK